MKQIPDGRIDMILCDLQYGTTQCKCDSIIPFDKLWEHYRRIIKPDGAVVLFGSEPFSSALRMSNIREFKYDWIWEKNKAQGFLNAKKMPLKDHETISVFYKTQPTYNPQGVIKIGKQMKNGGTKNSHGNKQNGDKTSANNSIKNENYIQEFTNYPKQIIQFKNSGNTQLHPTQKPIDLLEYLIRTYTNEGETVLDNCMGSGSTGVAALNTNRRFLGIELDTTYCGIAKKRILDIDAKYA
jgi:site-specific DNA-methyltransferase (adenine-specific)